MIYISIYTYYRKDSPGLCQCVDSITTLHGICMRLKFVLFLDLRAAPVLSAGLCLLTGLNLGLTTVLAAL